MNLTYVVRHAQSDDLDPLIKLQAELDYALKGQVWSEAYYINLRERMLHSMQNGHFIFAQALTLEQAQSALASKAPARLSASLMQPCDHETLTLSLETLPTKPMDKPLKQNLTSDLSTDVWLEQNGAASHLADTATKPAFIQASSATASAPTAYTADTTNAAAAYAVASPFAAHATKSQAMALPADLASKLDWNNELHSKLSKETKLKPRVETLPDLPYCKQHTIQLEPEQLKQIAKEEILLPEHTPEFIYNTPSILGAAYVTGISYTANSRHLYLSKLYTRPIYRRLGIATQILEFAFHQACCTHYAALSLDTSPSLSLALQIYLKHGFEPSTAPKVLHLAQHQVYLIRPTSFQPQY